ncbi:MAG: hemerythrin family protein [Oligoflexia bacterium]|nr:hemerythrin family protein [Oligoflexia bacterium]MBF0364169.1 hemerythrin family protein [Oligoflexia bacterium]
MSLFVWGQKYAIGVEEMDQQHQQLVDLINEVYDHRDHHSREHLCKIILSLIQYIEKHFRSEEDLMKNFHYPDLKEHKRCHDKLKKKVADLKNEVLDENKDVGESGTYLGIFLCRWLCDHILNEDQKYAKFINK